SALRCSSKKRRRSGRRPRPGRGARATGSKYRQKPSGEAISPSSRAAGTSSLRSCAPMRPARPPLAGCRTASASTPGAEGGSTSTASAQAGTIRRRPRHVSPEEGSCSSTPGLPTGPGSPSAPRPTLARARTPAPSAGSTMTAPAIFRARARCASREGRRVKWLIWQDKNRMFYGSWHRQERQRRHARQGGGPRLTLLPRSRPAARGHRRRDPGGLISAKIANDIFPDLMKEGAMPKAYVEAKGLAQVSDSGVIDQAVDKVIAANPAEVKAYKGGKTKLLSFFMGQVMRETKGKANPGMVSGLLKKKLGG
ncbi:MAG: hypothetical protein K6E40_06070, partial [Desulfovibrio sp.]|nr:hypothetical protein [Desulfovibrio sp.]